MRNGVKWSGTFMDRIYTNNSKHVSLFTKYADDNGFAHKIRQSYGSALGVVINRNSWSYSHIRVEVENTNVSSPFLDTFRDNNLYSDKFKNNGSHLPAGMEI